MDDCCTIPRTFEPFFISFFFLRYRNYKFIERLIQMGFNSLLCESRSLRFFFLFVFLKNFFSLAVHLRGYTYMKAGLQCEDHLAALSIYLVKWKRRVRKIEKKNINLILTFNFWVFNLFVFFFKILVILTKIFSCITERINQRTATKRKKKKKNYNNLLLLLAFSHFLKLFKNKIYIYIFLYFFSPLYPSLTIVSFTFSDSKLWTYNTYNNQVLDTCDLLRKHSM